MVLIFTKQFRLWWSVRKKDISLLNNEILISQLKTRTKLAGHLTWILTMGIGLGKSSKKPGNLGKYKGIQSGLVTVTGSQEPRLF